MKHIILTATAAIGLTSAVFAGPGDSGIGFMDDLITPYDDTKIELPGENAKKPSVSRSAQLVDDSETGAWNTRETESKSKPEKQAAQPKSGKSSSSASSSTSRDNDQDVPLPTRRSKISEVMGEGVPDVMTGEKLENLLHNPAREATKVSPTTPARWTRAPNDWFCDYDDAMSKAELSGRSVAVFFHSSTNNTSNDFKTDRMQNPKFRSSMRDRLLVVYLDYPEKEKGKDKRNRDQVDHDRRIADKYHVTSYPTVVFLSSDGTELGRINGASSINSFLDEIEKLLPQKETAGKKSTGFKMGGSIEFGESSSKKTSD